MRPITQYAADDGTVYSTADEARAHDGLVARCQRLTTVLSPHPEKSDQRVKQAHWRVFKQGVIDLCHDLYPDERVFTLPIDKIHPMGYAGRLISESRHHDVLWKILWFRLACMDADGYEYQQPFYGLNPHKWAEEVGEAALRAATVD